MRALFLCCLLVLSSVFCSASGLPPTNSLITVLVNYERPHSPSSFQALQSQLELLLRKAGLQLTVRERSGAAPHEQFNGLVVFQMKGSCSMASLPIGALSDERGALAMAYSTDGNILPFGAVECDRVRESLQRVVGRGAPEHYQAAFGAALGLVMAHEIYHMLAHSATHTRGGVTKESLSARELLQADLPFPEIARLAIRQSVHPN